MPNGQRCCSFSGLPSRSGVCRPARVACWMPDRYWPASWSHSSCLQRLAAVMMLEAC